MQPRKYGFDRPAGKVLFCAMLMTAFAGCINKKSDVDKVTSDDILPVESTLDGTILYSENAELKVKAFAPEINRYTEGEQYNEMPKGIMVIFYDSLGQESSRLRANYAIDRVSKNIMEAKNDVIIINEKKEQLNTEHLIWDKEKQMIYSDEFVKITTEDEIIMGEGFESNEQFTKYKILKPKGTIIREEDE